MRVLLLLFAVVVGLASGVAAAQAPLPLELPRIDGAALVHLDDYAGQPVLLNFWSLDCPPCRAEAPLLRAFAQAHPALVVLGVSVDAPEAAYRFTLLEPMPFAQLRAPRDNGGLMRRFGDPAGALPYTVLLTASHTLCRRHIGALDAAWLEAALAHCSTL